MSLMELGVITDEFDGDLDVALDVCERLGISAVELRSLGGKNVLALDERELDSAMTLVRQRNFDVTALATPIFKCPLPGAPPAAVGALHGAAATATLETSWPLLERALKLADAYGVPFVRVFSFWRVAEPDSVFEQVVDLLAEAQRRAEPFAAEVLLENEHDCNVATASETRTLLERLPGLRVIWDPANHVRAGGDPRDSAYTGFEDRIAHVHLKDVDRSGAWVVFGTGLVPYDHVMKSLLASGFCGTPSLETHCRVDGSTTEATIDSLTVARALLGSGL